MKIRVMRIRHARFNRTRTKVMEVLRSFVSEREVELLCADRYEKYQSEWN